MQTGFVAAGAGVRRGASTAQLRLSDVAPSITTLSGLDFDAPDGVAPRGFLADEGEAREE